MKISKVQDKTQPHVEIYFSEDLVVLLPKEEWEKRQAGGPSSFWPDKLDINMRQVKFVNYVNYDK